jgi:dsDNA-binding SOS-regulon protein
MTFNLLFLPLIGGFIFVRNWRPTRYYALRSDGHVLLFYSATASVVFALIAALIVFLFGSSCPDLDTFWHQMVPFEHSGKATIAFLLGCSLWRVLNLPFKDINEARRVVNRRRNPLEILFLTAMENKQAIAISLKNKKLYVGYVVSSANPAFALESVAVIPLMSGYRNGDDQTVTFTTRYIDAYDKMQTAATERVTAEAAAEPTLTDDEKKERIQEEADKEINIFRHVILVREIETAFVFRLDLYNKYFGPQVKPQISN